MIHPLPISKPRIQEFLRSCGLDLIPEIAKDRYYLPEKEWLRNEFSDGLTVAQRDENGATYQKWKWICNDFSRYAAHYAARCFAIDESCPPDGGLAFGQFKFVEPEGAHAINFAICASGSGSELELVTFEPQPPPRIVYLTEKETKSCFAISL